jgi:hypothetical protein
MRNQVNVYDVYEEGRNLHKIDCWWGKLPIRIGFGEH